MKLIQKCQLVLRKLYFFFLTQLVFLFSIIFIFPLISALFIYRKIIGFLVPLFDKTVSKITSGLTAIIACESELLSTAPTGNSLSCMTFSGVIDFEKCIKDFDEKVVNLSSEGNLLYPQFRQYFKRILGYTFFKWESNFDIREHAKEYISEKIINEDTIGQVAGELIDEPFKDQKSPWELVFLYKYKHSEDTSNNPKTVVFLRYSHALSDAFSMFSALSQNFIQHKDVNAAKWKKSVHKPANIIITIFKDLWYIFSGQLLYTLAKYKDNFGNGWLVENPNKKIHRVRVNPVPVELIKNIMKMYQISYTSALISGITGGIRNYMIEKNMPIPPAIHMTLPVVLPQRKPNNLVNHVSVTIFELPIGIEDPVKRNNRIQSSFLKLSTLPLPKIFPMLTKLTGCLPSEIILRKMSTSKKQLSLLGTLIPGPTSALWYKDHELQTVVAAGGFGRDNNGFGVAVLSYNKLCNISVGLDTAVVKKYFDAKKVITMIRDEFDFMAHADNSV